MKIASKLCNDENKNIRASSYFTTDTVDTLCANENLFAAKPL